MSVILEVIMDINLNGRDFMEAAKYAFPPSGAYEMRQLPTLQWKFYAIDPIKSQASGIYLFKDRKAAEARAKDAVLQLQQRPGVSNVTSRIWEIVEAPSRICNAPFDVPMIQDLPPLENKQ